jgi:Protein of unknown function (DUF1761)
MQDIYINHAAVLCCAVLNLVVGAIWYSPALFYKPWMAANRFTDEDMKEFKPAKAYSITLVLAVLICYSMAFFLGDAATDTAWGATAGFLAGFTFSAMIFSIIALFEQRSLAYIVINGGYITVYFTLVGLILGAWR